VEIVVTLSIIVILASILIAAINPNAILKRSRDVTRVQDLDTIDKAIQVMKIEISNFDELNYASQNIVYISLKDSSSTCGSYINELPSLPSGWQYRCSNSPTNIDGTGWIPFPFNQVPLLTLSKLPVDPINKPPYYYAFIVGGSFSLFTMLEDTQRTPNSKNDGDNFPHLYSTVNSNKNLINQAQGLVGYWSFDEGSGNIARDYSGNGNNGTLYSGTTVCSNPPTSGCPTWTTGKVGGALSFDGVDDWVEITGSPVIPSSDSAFVSMWINPDVGLTWDASFFGNAFVHSPQLRFKSSSNGIDSTWVLSGYGAPDWPAFIILSVSNSFRRNEWTLVSFGFNKNECKLKIYKNNFLLRETTLSSTYCTSIPSRNQIGVGWADRFTGDFFKGFIDEVRIYNRALSDSEIKALYDATK
jgi:hypothetical protein